MPPDRSSLVAQVKWVETQQVNASWEPLRYQAWLMPIGVTATAATEQGALVAAWSKLAKLQPHEESGG